MRLTAGGLVLVAILLRLAAGAGDLWTDEIWSIWIAGELDGPLRVLALPHDNNHILNTLYVQLIPDGAHALVYRGLALAAGMALVLALAQAAAPFGTAATLAALVLAAVSLPMVTLGSEARGYAPAALFALLAYGQIAGERTDEERSAPRFGIWVVLGMLSHLTFAFVYLALAGGSLVRALRRTGPSAGTVRELLRFHLLPGLFVAFFALFWIPRMVVGGLAGPAWWESAARVGTWVLGIPGGTAWDAPVTVLLLAVATSGVVWMRARGSGDWLMLGLLPAAPVLALAWFQPDFVYPRYFFVLIPFLLLAVAVAVGWMWHRGPSFRAGVILALGLFLYGQAGALADLIRHGRSQHQAALVFMQTYTEGSEVRLRGSDDFQVPLILGFYASRMQGMRLTYFPVTDRHEGAEWYAELSGTPGRPPPGFRPVLELPGTHQSWVIHRGPVSGDAGDPGDLQPVVEPRREP